MIAEIRKKTIAIDVDLTVVDTLTPWLNWIEQTQGEKFPLQDFAGHRAYSNKYVPPWIEHYGNMPGFMKQGMLPLEVDEITFMAYWSQPTLYQNLKPLDGVVEQIKRLSGKYNIVFVSHCIAPHRESKKKFLEYHFKDVPFQFLDVAGKQKHMVRYDWLIDDTVSVISDAAKANPRSEHILFAGVFESIVLAPYDIVAKDVLRKFLPEGVKVSSDWVSITNHILEQA